MKSTVSFIFDTLDALICLPTFLLIVAWLIKVSIDLYRTIKKYNSITKSRTEAQSPYRAVEIYNYKTHISKFIIAIAICIAELSQIIFAYLYRIVDIRIPKLDMDVVNVSAIAFGKTIHVSCDYDVLKFVFHPYLFLFFDLYLAAYILLMVLLSFLTRFLSLRYLRHPVKPYLLRYLAWLLFQFTLIALSSNSFTFPFLFVLMPVLSIVNWFLLVRESVFLSRVLNMNIRSIAWYSNNTRSFNNQLIAYNNYKLFRKLLLISLFISVIVIFFLFFASGFKLFICLTQYHSTLNPILNIMEHLASYIDPVFLFLYLLSYGLPFWTYTGAFCISKCSNKNQQYRFNYANTKIQPLLGNP